MPRELLMNNVASTLFYTIISSAKPLVDSILTNDPAKTMSPSQPPHFTAPCYHTFGFRSLEYPRVYFQKYFFARFAYESLSHGLLRPLKVASTEIQEDAKARCEEVAGNIINEFRRKAAAQFEGDDGLGLTGELDLTEFYKLRKDPKDPIEIDPVRVTDDALNRSIQAVKQLAVNVRDGLSQLAWEHFGNWESDTREHITGYERAADALRRLMRESIWRYGVNYLTGEPKADGGTIEGVLVRIDKVLTLRYRDVDKRLKLLERRLTNLLNSTDRDGDESDGLEQLKALVLSSIPSRFNRTTKLKRALDNFNLKRREYIQTYFERELLRHERDFLYAIAAGDETGDAVAQRTIEGEVIPFVPLVDQFENQAMRMKVLLTEAEEQCRIAYVQDLPREFLSTESDLLTGYLPPLGDFLRVERNEWRKDTQLDAAYRRLCDASRLERFQPIMRDLLDVDNNCDALGFDIGELCAAPGQTGQAQLRMLRDRTDAFVKERFFGDPATRQFLDRPLVEVFNSYSTDEQKKIREEFQRNLYAFSMPESSAVTKKAEVVVYASADGREPDAASLAAKLGYDGTKPQGIQYVPDEQNNRHRIIALKIKPNFVKEEFKNFIQELRSAYTDRDRVTTFPHLKKEWNSLGLLRTTDQRSLEVTLMLGLVFHLVLKHQKEPTVSKKVMAVINRLFVGETGGYDGLVQDSPIHIETIRDGKEKRLVACPGLIFDDGGKIKMATRAGYGNSLLIQLALPQDRYEDAITVLTKHEEVVAAVAAFKEKFLKGLNEVCKNAESRKSLFEPILNMLVKKSDQLKELIDRGENLRLGDKDTLDKMISEFRRFLESEVYQSPDQSEDTEDVL
ncbi:MAG: hypothetical protein KIT57_10455 [Blastocatellales bacterium]|nr:hypothetical protein [Blastocatellales bacterium]